MNRPLSFVDDLRCSTVVPRHELIGTGQVGNGEQTYHFVGAPDKDRDRSGVGALLDNEHFVTSRPKGDLTDDSSMPQFFGTQVFKPRYNSAICGNGDQLQSDNSWIKISRGQIARYGD